MEQIVTFWQCFRFHSDLDAGARAMPLIFKDQEIIMKKPLIIKKLTILCNLGWPLLIYMLCTLSGYRILFSEEVLFLFRRLSGNTNMKREIAAAVCCFKTLLMPKTQPDPEKTDLFFERLSVALMEKFSGHWFPENPSRGQAYRYGSLSNHTFNSRLISEQFLAA